MKALPSATSESSKPFLDGRSDVACVSVPLNFSVIEALWRHSPVFHLDG